MTSSDLKISVITPSFRAVDTIGQTIRSVIDQGYHDLEYIVIDGAGDGTSEIIRRYESAISFWCSEPDDGQYRAIEKGFARATGDILCWINADDILMPGSLAAVSEIFHTFPEVQWLTSLKQGILDADGKLWKMLDVNGFSREAFLDGFNLQGERTRAKFIQQESTFFRRSLWERAGGKIPDLALGGDFALWCEFFKHADLYGVSHPLAAFRRVEGQRSSDVERYAEECRTALLRLRQESGWRDSIANTLRDSSLAAVPKVRGLLREVFGYTGLEIIKKSPLTKGAGWTVEKQKYLPG